MNGSTRARAIVAIAFVALGCRPAPPPGRQDVIVWRELGSWSGHGNAQTGSFGHSGVLRIRWKTSNEAPQGASRLKISIQSSVSGRVLAVAVDQQGPGTGESITAEMSPVVYAFVESGGVDWSFTVEEGLIGSPGE